MIETLVQDIYSTISKKDGWFNEELARDFSSDTASRLQGQLGQNERTPTLRLSQMGPRCPKALWHSIHTPHEAEKLPPWAEVKYSFGHIVEALAITLAKAAGHEVTGEQDELVLDGIVGHRDCVIDGCVVDVKSSSSRGMDKFKNKTLSEADSFGYLDQLDGYVVASREDPLVRVKDKGYILAIDKTLGHMVLYEHRVREESIRARIKSYKSIVGLASPPDCTCGTVKQGEAGNIALDTRASYNLFKHCCFPRLRTFLYANGPVYLTRVVKRPKDRYGRDMMEIDRYGKPVYEIG